MKVVLAFDVDRTLDISEGPVSLSRLRELKNSGFIVGFAGADPKNRVEEVNRVESFDFYYGSKALDRIEDEYPNADIYIHVGDREEDRETAEEAGWTYVNCEEFK